jgi:RNA polymerase sigma-70 factor (ECF subfamily)
METSDEQDALDMARLADGNDAALNELMERHAQKLFHYLLRNVQNESDAADLAQETFVRVYQSRARFRRGAKFTTWLYTIATNLVRDRYRWRTRHPQVSLEAENTQTGGSLGETLAEAGAGPAEHLQAAERAESVRRAVARLPVDLREALILAEYENCSHAEMAEVLNCSVKAVESRLYRARQQLKDYFTARPEFAARS